MLYDFVNTNKILKDVQITDVLRLRSHVIILTALEVIDFRNFIECERYKQFKMEDFKNTRKKAQRNNEINLYSGNYKYR